MMIVKDIEIYLHSNYYHLSFIIYQIQRKRLREIKVIMMFMFMIIVMMMLLTTQSLSLSSYKKIRYSSSSLLKPSLLLKSSTLLSASSSSVQTKVGDVNVNVDLLKNLVLNDANGNKKV